MNFRVVYIVYCAFLLAALVFADCQGWVFNVQSRNHTEITLSNRN